MLLKDFRNQFLGKYAAKVDTAGEGAINAKSMLKKIREKYEDPTSQDKLSEIKKEVDATTAIMADTIQGTLSNIEKTEDLADDVDRLKVNAALFNNNAHKLKNNMRWKNW